ncbi:hypothetical protein QYE76_055963 [Lolium multiflorum]|uniref:Reverse transcriptase zinc-binding domain-containing protein n=1 Tax=Lolium multiflorum TaxID=4521 RepID=A0AAD8T194_LOLMU|nr:hypothetical protein QYE76_055963 [Lolium multiflorum]
MHTTLGNGTSTAFWLDLWLGNSTLQDRFPILFSHSARLNLNVATALSHDIRHFLVPRLSAAAASELRDLSMELSSVHLNIDNPDIRVCRLTNKKLSNKTLYASTFSHLQVDDVATKVWRSAAPLKCKIFCWLARKKRLPTNERRFRHHLNGSATCLACPLDEDTDHLLLLCPRAKQRTIAVASRAVVFIVGDGRGPDVLFEFVHVLKGDRAASGRTPSPSTSAAYAAQMHARSIRVALPVDRRAIYDAQMYLNIRGRSSRATTASKPLHPRVLLLQRGHEHQGLQRVRRDYVDGDSHDETDSEDGECCFLAANTCTEVSAVRLIGRTNKAPSSHDFQFRYWVCH